MSITYQKEIPVIKETDVLVLGAGPAGIGAAISAARNGAKTLCVEANGCVGGMATIGMVGPFMTSYDAHAKEMVVRGIFEEIVDDLVERGKAIHPGDVHNGESRSSFFRIGHDNVGPFDAEVFKLRCTEKILEAGAKLLLHTQFVDVLKDEKSSKIVGVVVSNKDGLGVIKAKIIIDCTGDADVAYRAGVKTVLGNEQDGNIQPMSLFLRVSDVDTEAVAAHMAEHKEEIRPFYGPYSWLIKEKQDEWDVPRAECCVFEDVEPGIYHLNVTRVLNADGTKAEDLTRAEVECMQQAHKVFNFMKKNAVGFKNAKLIDVADTIGIRETRHIDGEYKLTGAEVEACDVQDDAIAVMATCMDTHNLDNPGGSFMPPKNGPYFGVPYKCLVAKGVDNLFVAGRSISADSMAASAIRMMPSCMAFGEAAGLAAAICMKKNILPRDVDTQELREKLTKQGAFVG